MFSKMVSFAMALASRGFSDNKVDIPTKQLRAVSCFGFNTISPCKELKESKTEGKHYCGACKCGDKKHTWLLKSSDEYSKLDYPKLNCPLGMPGFSNYDPNTKSERKDQIESLDPEDIKFVQVTIGKLATDP
jgi:hypothetical protein